MSRWIETSHVLIQGLRICNRMDQKAPLSMIQEIGASGSTVANSNIVLSLDTPHSTLCRKVVNVHKHIVLFLPQISAPKICCYAIEIVVVLHSLSLSAEALCLLRTRAVKRIRKIGKASIECHPFASHQLRKTSPTGFRIKFQLCSARSVYLVCDRPSKSLVRSIRINCRDL